MAANQVLVLLTTGSLVQLGGGGGGLKGGVGKGGFQGYKIEHQLTFHNKFQTII